jgi:hypothetical protein
MPRRVHLRVWRVTWTQRLKTQGLVNYWLIMTHRGRSDIGAMMRDVAI